MNRIIPLDKLGEASRIDVRNAVLVSVRASADTSGSVVELKGAIGSTGKPESFDPVQTLELDGSTITTIDVARFSHLVLEVTTAAGVVAMLEVNAIEGVAGNLEVLDLSLDREGEIWRRSLRPHERVLSISVDYSSSDGSPALKLARAVDKDGQLTEWSSVSESIQSFELEAIESIGLVCETASEGVRATVTVYTAWNPESIGVLGSDVVRVSGGTPADGEYLVRSGGAYDSTNRLLAGDGTEAAPSIGFLDDSNNGLYRASADIWGLSCGGDGLLGLSNNGFFTSIDFDGGIVNLTATLALIGEAPDWVLVNSSAAAAAKLSLREATANGSNYFQFRAPDALGANITITLPDAIGAAGDIITIDGSGVLSFADPASIEYSGMKSGASQGAAGASAGELWHDTADNTVKLGV